MTVIDDLFSLRGRTALVTGGSSGIGYAMAEAIAGAGARTVLLARRQEALRAAVGRIGEHGGEAYAVSADITDRARLAGAAEEAVALVGEIDILVNCAANMFRPPLTEQTTAQWDALWAPVWTSGEAATHDSLADCCEIGVSHLPNYLLECRVCCI